MPILRYKEEGNPPLAHLERKSLGEFIQFIKHEKLACDD
jgi:hypothetical protein